jgi:hypothetical protein
LGIDDLRRRSWKILVDEVPEAVAAKDGESLSLLEQIVVPGELSGELVGDVDRASVL